MRRTKFHSQRHEPDGPPTFLVDEAFFRYFHETFCRYEFEASLLKQVCGDQARTEGLVARYFSAFLAANLKFRDLQLIRDEVPDLEDWRRLGFDLIALVGEARRRSKQRQERQRRHDRVERKRVSDDLRQLVEPDLKDAVLWQLRDGRPQSLKSLGWEVKHFIEYEWRFLRYSLTQRSPPQVSSTALLEGGKLLIADAVEALRKDGSVVNVNPPEEGEGVQLAVPASAAVCRLLATSAEIEAEVRETARQLLQDGQIRHLHLVCEDLEQGVGDRRGDLARFLLVKSALESLPVAFGRVVEGKRLLTTIQLKSPPGEGVGLPGSSGDRCG